MNPVILPPDMSKLQNRQDSLALVWQPVKEKIGFNLTYMFYSFFFSSLARSKFFFFFF